MVNTSFPNLLKAIGQTDTGPDPSELHGTLCGILCVRQNHRMNAWIGEFAPQASNEEKNKLINLLKLTQEQLDRSDLNFHLLLPEDNQPLSKRTAALASWCRGFLYGLGIGGLTKETPLDLDVQEILTDMAQIAKAEHRHSNDDTSENEAAYYEIVEYLRMGVLLIYESLYSARGSMP